MGTKTVKCQSTCKLLGMQASSVQQSSGQLEPAMWKLPGAESNFHGILHLTPRRPFGKCSLQILTFNSQSKVKKMVPSSIRVEKMMEYSGKPASNRGLKLF